jgi:methionine sulfoxide reductase catalytic subunit
MLIKKTEEFKSSEITPKRVYLDRREFMRGAALAGAAAAVASKLGGLISPEIAHAGSLKYTKSDLSTHGEELTPLKDITNYNNYYEFGTDKYSPASEAQQLVTHPWKVSVEGLCAKPRTYTIDELMDWPLEERVYRMRCVEGWSMVIPWIGFQLSKLIEAAQPKPQAKYVAFETLYDPAHMPGLKTDVLQWPYVEGLRMDEAMQRLTILAVGIYGDPLPKQDGAPIRLVVPWKYGFKGIKSIVKIKFVDSQPPTTWNIAAPDEYGFYSNVNPNVDHPRWSQKKERRIGEFFKRDTLMFNGYGNEVAKLYTGMDLRKYF